MESSEKRLKEKVLRMLKSEFRDAWVYKTSDRWRSGIPDILICHKGCFVATELKAGRYKATKLQRYVLEMIRRAGGRAAVCRSVDEVRNLLNEARS